MLLIVIVIWHMLVNAILEWSDGGILAPFFMSGAMERSGKNRKEWSEKWSSLQKYWSVHNPASNNDDEIRCSQPKVHYLVQS